MTIRFKILALAFAILVVFGMVVGISTWLQHQFMNQIVAITRYHIPLKPCFPKALRGCLADSRAR